MSDNKSELLKKIGSETWFLRRHKLLLVIVATLAVFIAPALILGLVDINFPVRERTALVVMLVPAAIAVLFLLASLVRFATRLPGARDVALKVEGSQPELMDSLICAVELLRDKPAASLSGIQQALVVSVEDRLKNKNLRPLVAGTAIGTGSIVVLVAVGGALMYLLAGLPLAEKASARVGDMVTGNFTGLTITPGDIEIAIGETMIIEVAIERGPKEAQIIFEFADGPAVYEMYEKSEGVRYFELFAIDAPFTYRVVTPWLESPVHAVTTFQNPAIIATTIKVEPPAYTGIEAQLFDELKDVAVPEGTKVSLEFTANMPSAVTLDWEERPDTILSSSVDDVYSTIVTATQSDSYTYALEDKDGHAIKHPKMYQLEVVEDFPPLIEPITPEEDAAYKPDADVAFSCKVTDEYGIAAAMLHYSISGRDWAHVMLYENDSESIEKTKTLVHAMALAKFDIYEGDVISYYYEAADNEVKEGPDGTISSGYAFADFGDANAAAQTGANVASTDVRFIEVRPEPPAPGDAPGGEGECPAVSLSVANLITEQKYLIQQTVHAQRLPLPSEQGKELLSSLATAANELHDATEKVLLDAKKGAGDIHLGVVENLFGDALVHMKSTHTELFESRPGPALSPEQKALKKLVEIEIEIAATPKNTQPSESESSEQSEAAEQEEQEEREADLDKIKEALERLNDLIGRQENLNDKFEMRARSIMSPAARGFMRGTQGKIQEDADELKEELAPIGRAVDAVKELSKASRTMTHWQTHITMARDPEVTASGDQALTFLQRAKDLLESVQDELSGDEVEKLNEDLQALRKEQKELRKETQKPASEDKAERREMAGNQKQIREEFEELMENISQCSGKMEAENPEASESLSKCRNAGNNAGTSGAMKRAENGLKYGRNEKASEFQGEAEKAMAEMSQHMQDAMNSRPGLSNEQLTRMLGETLQDIEKARAATDDEETTEEAEQELLGEFAEDLEAIADEMQDPQMSELSMQMHGWNISGSSDGDRPVNEALGLLIQTAQLLEAKLFKNAVQRRLDLAQVNGREPPDEYKKRVQEYFIRLSNNPF